MSEDGIVRLLDLMTLTRQEADMSTSNFVTEPELVSYIQNSYKDLYNLLVGAYGEDYQTAIPVIIKTSQNQDKYPLPDGNTTFLDEDGNTITPPPFYKLLGVDLQLSQNNPQGYVTIKTFAFSDRNKFAIPNFASFWGFSNLRYRLFGNKIWFTPIPITGQNIRLFYVPRPINLINTILGSTTDKSTTMNVTDIVAPKVGMSVFGTYIAPGTTITAVGSTTVTLSLAALGTSTNLPVQIFDYNTPIDGIAGWEEVVVISAAVKCKDKEESDVTVLAARYKEKKEEIEGIAANRDPGSAAKTADVMNDMWNNNGNNGYGEGGG